MNYLGIDWGKKKIGLAIGNDQNGIASPILILTFHDIKELDNKLKEIVEKEDINAIVVGKPVSLSGQMKANEDFDGFLRMLHQYHVDVELEDERFSTDLVKSIKKQFKAFNKTGDDDIAAAAILQSYLDKRRG